MRRFYRHGFLLTGIGINNANLIGIVQHWALIEIVLAICMSKFDFQTFRQINSPQKFNSG